MSIRDEREIAGQGQVQAARLLARMVVGAFEAAESEGKPMLELQKAALVEVALLAFDGYRAEMLGLLATDERIRAAVAEAEARGDGWDLSPSVRVLRGEDRPA